MTSSIDYLDFQIASSFNIPESLRQLLYKAWQNRYEEFYEESANRTITLEETLWEILDALRDKSDLLSHDRYIWMALILALAVESTVKAYFPDDQTTQKIFQVMIECAQNQTVPTEETINQLFFEISVENQAIDEALDVFKNLLRVIDVDQAQEAVLEILDDCLEGYAIFPGSQGRRDLFAWLLFEVLPAAWFLKSPECLYTINGIISFNSTTLSSNFKKIFDDCRNQAVV